MDHRGHGDAEEHSPDPAHLDPHEERREDQQGVDAHGAAEDAGHQEVHDRLLVDQEDRPDPERRSRRLRESHEDGRHQGQRQAHQRDEHQHGREQAQQDGNPQPEDPGDNQHSCGEDQGLDHLSPDKAPEDAIDGGGEEGELVVQVRRDVALDPPGNPVAIDRDVEAEDHHQEQIHADGEDGGDSRQQALQQIGAERL